MMTDSNRNEKWWNYKNKLKSRIMGTSQDKGLLAKIIIYLLLFLMGFIFIFPLLTMLSTSAMSLADLLDSSVRWLPTRFYTRNFEDALRSMDFWNSLWRSIVFVGVPAILQTAVCAITGYGFARYNFRGKKVMLVILVLTFILPPQILMMPIYLLYFNMGLLGSMWAFTLPAVLGQGFQSAIMVLIFYQFYTQIPTVLTEAAELDGASQLKIFWFLGIRSALPAIIVVFSFSFVFYWNDTALTTLYLGTSTTGVGSQWTTLQLELSRISDTFGANMPTGQSGNLNEGIRFAGTLLSILPLFFLVGFLQRHLVESIDGAGITGE